MLYKTLSTRARTLKKQLAAIGSPDETYRGHWVASSLSKGKRYYRLRRWKDGKTEAVRNLKSDEVAEVRTSIQLLRKRDSLTSQLATVNAKMERLVTKAQKLGIPIKNPLGDRDATVEWYTPSEYIDLARKVLKGIDLDVASNAKAQAWIQAGVYYTKEQDGLSQPWFGKVWCNPPYGSDSVRLLGRKFLERAIDAYESGEIEAAIVLLNRTGAKWYKDALQRVSAVCEVHKRIAFIDAEGNQQRSPRYYNDFLYLGKYTAFFKVIFRGVGTVSLVTPFGQ